MSNTTPNNIQWDESSTTVVSPPSSIEWDTSSTVVNNSKPESVPLTMIKNMYEGAKESIGGIIQSIGETITTPHADRSEDRWKELDHKLREEDKKKRRKLGLPAQDESYYMYNTDWLTNVDKTWEANYRKKQQTQGTDENILFERSKNVAPTGQKMVKDSIQQQQINKQKANIQPGTMKDFLVNLGTGFGESVPALLTTVVTKNPTAFLTYTGLSSYGKSYAEARLKGADQESSLLNALASGGTDVLMNVIPVGEVFKPSNQIIKSVIKQAGLEGTYNAIGSLLKSAVEKGTVTPDMTLEDALKNAGLQGLTAAAQGGVMKFANLTVFKQPQHEPKLSQEVAIETITPKKTSQEVYLKQQQAIIDSIRPYKDGYVLPDGSKITLKQIEKDLGVTTKEVRTPISDKEKSLRNLTGKDLDKPDYVVTQEPIHFTDKEKLEVFKKYVEVGPKKPILPDAEPRTPTTEDFKKIATGEIEPPDNNNPDSLLIKPIKDKTSEAYLNTIKSNTPEGILKQFFPETEGKYTPDQVQSWKETASKNLNDDKEAVITKLNNKPNDPVSMMETGILYSEALNKGNMNDVLKYGKILVEQGSQAGKELRAFQDVLTEVKSPGDGILAAQTEIQRAINKKLKKEPGLSEKDLPKLTSEDAQFIRDKEIKALEQPEGSIKRQYYLYDIKKRIQNVIRKAQKGKFLDGLVEYTTGNVLWGPDTILFSNTIGNFSRIALDSFESYLHGAIHWGITGDAKVIREAQAIGMGYKEGLKQIYDLKDSLAELRQLHKQDLANNPTKNFGEWIQDIANYKDKVVSIMSRSPGEIVNEIHASYRSLSSDPLSKEAAEGAMGVFLDTFGSTQRLAFDALSGLDTVQKYVAYYGAARGEVNRQAELSGLIGPDKSIFENNLWNDVKLFSKGQLNKDSVTPKQWELISAIHKIAVDNSVDAAWQGKTPESLKQLASNPYFKLLVNKFFTTPYNLIKYSIKQMPMIDFLQKTSREDLLGNNGEDACIKAWSKQVKGFMIYGGLFTMVNTLEITGQHPTETRKTLKEAGIPEYSIKIGDTWYGYRKYEPIATILGTMATVKEHWKYYSREDKDFIAKVMMTSLAALDNISSSTMLKGIKDVLTFLDPVRGEKTVQGQSPYLYTQERSMLPFSSLFTGLQRGSIGLGKNPHIPEVKNMIDQFNAIYRPDIARPSLSAITGKIIENEGSFMGAAIDHSELDNPALMKLAQLDMRVTDPDVSPFGVNLTPEEYWEYRRFIDTKLNFSDILNKEVVKPEFEHAPVGVQKKILTEFIENFRRVAAVMYLQEKNKMKEIPGNKMKEVQKVLEPSEPLVTPNTENKLF